MERCRVVTVDNDNVQVTDSGPPGVVLDPGCLELIGCPDNHWLPRRNLVDKAIGVRTADVCRFHETADLRHKGLWEDGLKHAGPINVKW